MSVDHLIIDDNHNLSLRMAESAIVLKAIKDCGATAFVDDTGYFGYVDKETCRSHKYVQKDELLRFFLDHKDVKILKDGDESVTGPKGFVFVSYR